MLQALRGHKPDRIPAAPCYLSLYMAERVRAAYIEQYRERLGGRRRYRVEHAEDTHFRAQALYRAYAVFKSPPDWIEVETGASRAWAERTEITRQGDVLFYHDLQDDTRVAMDSIPMPREDERLRDMTPVAQDVWDRSGRFASRADVEAHMPIVSREDWLAGGAFDLPRQVVSERGERCFISTVLDTPFSDAYGVLGFRGLMVFQRQKPDLLQYLLQRQLMRSTEMVHAWAETGIHGIFVEEVFAGADCISPASYDTFVHAYNQPYFHLMRSLGLLPIYYLCGDALPRVKRMLECNIAAVATEESKKKFRIEIADVVAEVGGRAALFGNIDAIHFGIQSTPEEMAAEVRRQCRIGAGAGGFIAGTGSPFPLETDPAMIDVLVEAAHGVVPAPTTPPAGGCHPPLHPPDL